MTQVILVDGVKTANPDLLDQQLKAIAPDDCYGLNIDKDGLHLVVSDTISGPLLGQLKNAVQIHNPAELTERQQKETNEKNMLAIFLAASDKEVTLPMLANALRFVLRQLGQG